MPLSVVDPRQHVAHFYASEDELIGHVSAYVIDALTSDETVMVVATPSHVTAFEAVLVGAGIDLVRARSESRLITLDAQHVLRDLGIDGCPSLAEFTGEVEDLISRLLESGRPLRVYGEVVALLWEAGLVGAAIDLENAWKGLIERFSFGLYCSYPGNSLGAIRNGSDGVRRVCDCHTAVMGSQSPIVALDGAEAAREFPWDLVAVATSRRFVADTLIAWDLNHVVDDASLIVSELATNAVMHARSTFTVLLSYEAGTLCISVRDGSPGVPSVKHAPGTVILGRGLSVVEGIARRWGTDRDGVGKLVWAELPT